MFSRESFNFSGKTALVTGAGRGIGRALALGLANSGAKVYAITRNPDNLISLKSECPQIETLQCDLSDMNQTRQVMDSLPPVDYLVNNAAIIHHGSFLNCSIEEVDSMYKTNLASVLLVSQIVAKKMIANKVCGSIVNISSVAGLRPLPTTAGYSMLKAGLDQLTKIMAVELGPHGIRVNSLNPGPVMTDMLIHFMNREAETNGGEDPMATLNSKTCYTQKIIEMKEILNSVMFLLSDAAPMIHGALVPIEGGMQWT